MKDKKKRNQIKLKKKTKSQRLNLHDNKENVCQMTKNKGNC